MKLVNFKIAKLAYQKGFREICEHAITKEAVNNGYNYVGEKFDQDHIDAATNDHGEHYLCPYQYQLMDWLRKEKGYYININPIEELQSTCFVFELSSLGNKLKRDHDYYDYYSDNETYEEALNQALIYTLNLI